MVESRQLCKHLILSKSWWKTVRKALDGEQMTHILIQFSMSCHSKVRQGTPTTVPVWVGKIGDIWLILVEELKKQFQTAINHMHRFVPRFLGSWMTFFSQVLGTFKQDPSTQAERRTFNVHDFQTHSCQDICYFW